MEKKKGMNKKGISFLEVGAFIVMAFFILVISVIILVATNTTTPLVDVAHTWTTTDTILNANGSTTTLTYLPSSFTSATSRNNTFLNFVNNGSQVTGTYGQPTNLNHTYSLWFNTSAADATDKVLLISTFGTERIILSSGGVLKYVLTNSSSIPLNLSYSGLNDARWHHLAIAFNESGANVTMYVDGIAVNGTAYGTGNVTGITTDTNVSAPSSNAWYGYIDEVRIYNQTLGNAEIKPINSSLRIGNQTLYSTNLQVWMKFSELSGSTAYDVQRGNNGTIINATYADDGINRTAVSGTDYSRTGQSFLVTTQNFAWTPLYALYDYSNTTNDLKSIANPVSSGLSSFWSSTTTWFLLIGLIIIITILAVVIMATRGFSGVGAIQGESSI